MDLTPGTCCAGLGSFVWGKRKPHVRVGGRDVTGWFPASGKRPAELFAQPEGLRRGRRHAVRCPAEAEPPGTYVCGSPEGLAEPVGLVASSAFSTSAPKQPRTSDAPASQMD